MCAEFANRLALIPGKSKSGFFFISTLLKTVAPIENKTIELESSRLLIRNSSSDERSLRAVYSRGTST